MNESDKSRILADPSRFSEEELAEALRGGVVTMYELSKTGCITPMKRRRIEQLLEKPVSSPQPEIASPTMPSVHPAAVLRVEEKPLEEKVDSEEMKRIERLRSKPLVDPLPQMMTPPPPIVPVSLNGTPSGNTGPAGGSTPPPIPTR